MASFTDVFEFGHANRTASRPRHTAMLGFRGPPRPGNMGPLHEWMPERSGPRSKPWKA